MSIEVTYLISLVLGFASLAGLVYNTSRSRKQDAKQDASIAFELKALQTSLTEFKTEIKMSMESNNKMTLDNHDKGIKHDHEIATAFRRIDELREAVKR